MRIRDYLFLAFKNLSRRKGSFILSTILLTIAVAIFVLAFSFTIALKTHMNRAIVNNVSYRTIVVLGIPEEELETKAKELEQIDHITKALNNDYYMASGKLTNVENYNEERICFYGCDSNTQPSVTKGRNIKDGERKVCLAPEKIYFNTFKDYDKDKYLDGNELLGKTIRIEYYSYDRSNGDENSVINKTFYDEYEVVGLYDAGENFMDGDSFFASFDDTKEIRTNIENSTISRPENEFYHGASPQLIAIVDNAKNVDVALEDVEEFIGYRALIRSTIDTYIVYIIDAVVGVVLAILVIIVLINITSSSVKSMNERKYEIGMLKAIGYKNKTIQNMLITENLIIGILSFAIGFVIAFIAMIILQNEIFTKDYQMDQMNAHINVIISLIALIGACGIPILSSMSCGKKTFKKTPVALNKER